MLSSVSRAQVLSLATASSEVNRDTIQLATTGAGSLFQLLGPASAKILVDGAYVEKASAYLVDELDTN